MNFNVNFFFQHLLKRIRIPRQKVGARLTLPVPERNEHAEQMRERHCVPLVTTEKGSRGHRNLG